MAANGVRCFRGLRGCGAASRPVGFLGLVGRRDGRCGAVPRRLPICAVLDPDNANILVAGGGGVAMKVVQKLKDNGSWVWFMQRSDKRREEIEKMMAVVVEADALEKDQVDKAFAGIEQIDAVVSTVGGGPMDARADSEGNINLIEAAAKKGAKRFLLVTSIGTGDSKDAVAKQTYEVLEKVLIEKEKAERRLKELGSEMEYVIIRPGGLKSEPATGEGFLTDDNTVCGSIHRDDVASLVVDALFSDKATNKVLAALDKNQVNGKPVLKPFEV